MREQVATPVFPPPLDRKKLSLKKSGREGNIEHRRRLYGGYVNFFGGNSNINMPDGRLKGGSSSIYSNDQDLLDAGEENIEDLNGSEKMEKLNGLQRLEKLKENKFDAGGHKRLSLEDDLFLQWGSRKRPRGASARLEPKHDTIDAVDASHPSENTIRVDRQVAKAEKRLVVSQIQATAYSRGQPLRPCTPALHENGLRLGRRNGQDFECTPMVGINDCCPPTDIRHFVHHTAERPDRLGFFSPHKNGTAFASPQDTDSSSPDDGAAVSIQNDGEALQNFAPSLRKVDSELLEWPRILISLSRKEKEDDFMAIKGSKLPHRPKRRPKVVEKALHYCS
eukprot:c14827_g1_i1 orf=1-1008(-)